MNFVLKPSLEHMTLVKIAVTLWNQRDVRDLMSTFPDELDDWSDIEYLVTEKVPKLLHPEPLKEKILNFIKPIGVEILKWIEFHRKRCNIILNLPEHFYWTPQGTIDTEKTIKDFLKDEELDLIVRYKLACIYCLEDDVVALWKQIPADIRFIFYSEDFTKQKWLVYLWTCEINKEMDRLDRLFESLMTVECSPYEYAFSHAAATGNKAATKYFLKKLTPEEKEKSLALTTIFTIITHCCFYLEDSPREPYSDIVCFLLSQMDVDNQISVFRRANYKLLACLLDWPYQPFFLEVAGYMWDYLSDEVYEYLIRLITCKVIDGYRDFDYLELLREFVHRNPNIYP